jgi:hypothetical protein
VLRFVGPDLELAFAGREVLRFVGPDLELAFAGRYPFAVSEGIANKAYSIGVLLPRAM